MTSFHKENIRKICICFNQSKTLREQSSHGEATISLGYVIFTLGTTPIGGSTSLFNNPSLPCENVRTAPITRKQRNLLAFTTHGITDY